MTPIANNTRGQTPNWDHVSTPAFTCIEMARDAMAEMEEHLHELHGLLINCLWPGTGFGNLESMKRAQKLISAHLQEVEPTYYKRIEKLGTLLLELNTSWEELTVLPAFVIPTIAEMEKQAAAQTEGQFADEQAAALANGYPEDADDDEEDVEEDNVEDYDAYIDRTTADDEYNQY